MLCVNVWKYHDEIFPESRIFRRACPCVRPRLCVLCVWRNSVWKFVPPWCVLSSYSRDAVRIYVYVATDASVYITYAPSALPNVNQSTRLACWLSGLNEQTRLPVLLHRHNFPPRSACPPTQEASAQVPPGQEPGQG